jgi:hypothetical protein
VRRKTVVWALVGVTLLGASCRPYQVPRIAAAVTGDSSGGAIAVYQIWQVSDSYCRFYVQKVSPEGDLPWGEKGVLLGSGYSEAGYFYSRAVGDGSGGAVVIWVEFLLHPAGELPSSQTHAARIDSEGNVKWQRDVPGDIPGFGQAIPDGSGGAIIAYRALYEEKISVLKIDGEGNLPWGRDGVSLNLSGSDSQCKITTDNLGGVIVVQKIAGEGIICAQRVDSGGDILWQSGGIKACVGPAEGAEVVSDGAGGAIIAYIRDIPCGGQQAVYCDSHIHAQRIDAEGNVLWGSDGVPICAEPGPVGSPRIVADGAGGAIISFSFLGVHEAVRADRIDADGHVLWENEDELRSGIIVSDGSGGVISVWDGGEGINATAQRLDAMGRELWGPDGLTLRDLRPSLAASDDCGGVLISWSVVDVTGSKASALSYYVQRIDAEGNLPWGDEGILLNP